MVLGSSKHSNKSVVSGLRALVLSVTLALVAGMTQLPAAAAEETEPPDYTTIAASSPGDAWDSTDGGTGAAVATFGHIGCTSLDAAQQCAGGLWGKVPDAVWVWRSQLPDFAKNEATFTKTFTASSGQAGQPAVLQIAADNLFTATLNGTVVLSGSAFTQGTSVSVPLLEGANTFTVQVTNQLNGQSQYNNPAGVAWSIQATGSDVEEPPTTPYQPPLASAGADQEVTEGSVVTLDGSGSRASTKPALESPEKAGTLPGGTALGVRIAGLDPESGGLRLQGKVDIGQGPPAQNTSLAYVIDVSGSTSGGGGCGGDTNGDRSNNTVLDCEIAAALKWARGGRRGRHRRQGGGDPVRHVRERP